MSLHTLDSERSNEFIDLTMIYLYFLYDYIINDK